MKARCIYCLEEKPPEAFTGREHVTPQAYGRFENNLALRCCCGGCTTYFGRGIDMKFGRDSVEAVVRVNAGLKSAQEFKSLGRRSTSYVEIQGGPYAGAKGYVTANRDGDDGTLGV